jgi:hypothetical protein
MTGVLSLDPLLLLYSVRSILRPECHVRLWVEAQSWS